MSKDIYEVPAHEYSLAGVIRNVQGHVDKESNTYQEGLFNGMDAGLGNAMGAIGSAVGGMAGAAIGGGKTSPAGDVIGGLGKIAGAIPGPWGAIAGAGLGVISGLTNAAFGSKINQENVNAINNNITALNSFKSNASSFDDLSQNINSQPTAMRFNQSTVGSDGWFSNKAKNMYKDLVAQQDAAQQFVNNSITNNMNNLVNTQYQNLAASYAAQGGPLETHGAEWNTGLNYIGAGGSHESNPNNGVQMGIAPDGLPNLVEEGEVIWNGDYVFSKRLKVNKSDKEKLKLGHKDDSLSFADAALKLNKEMDEMPNDPIAKRSRDAMLGRLADAQEIKRAKIQAKEQQKAMMTQALLGNAPIEEPMEETPEMMQPEQPEQPAQEEQPQSQMTPEEYMAQQTTQGMPMESMYAAKGGRLEHRYDNGSWKLNNDVWNWLDKLSEAQYKAIVTGLYKEGSKDYNRFINNKRALFDRANYKKIGDVHKALSTAYANNNKTSVNPSISQLNEVKEAFDTTPEYNFLDAMGVPPGDATNLMTPEERFAARWNTKYNGIPLLGPTTNYKPQVKVINPAAGWIGYDNNGNPIGPDGKVINAPLVNGVYDYTPKVTIPDTEKGLNIPESIPTSETIIGSSNYPWEGYLKYAPVVGSAIGAFTDLIGLTNKPDYSAANALASATSNLRDVSFTPIGDYATYKPVDIMAPINQINANAGATRRNIINTSGGNRGTAMAGLLAADNTFNNTIGQTYINAENTNYDRYMKALAHNASINQFNSQGALQAATANQKMDEVRARYSALAADARAKALQQSSATRSANLTTLFDNLGNLGIDALNRADAKELAQLWAGADRFASTQHKKGGKLNKKVKRRYII